MDFNDEMEGYSDDEMLGHNLQVVENPRLRRVSFPESDTELVTGYLEPVDPLRLARNVDLNELREAYENSCFRHDTRPIETVLNQLQNLVFNNLRCDKITLFTDTLTHSQCESLEEILKRLQFNHIYFEGSGFTAEIAYPLFQMFEYYESALHVDINFGYSHIGIKGAEAVAKYLQESNALEEFSAYHLRLTGRECEALYKSLHTTINLQILKLSNCNVVTGRLDMLVNALIKNETVKELHLPYNHLEEYEAKLLGKLLQFNKRIQLLDLSNNHIEDAGVEKLVTGIVNGTGGLEVLVLWSNKLTVVSAAPLSYLLRSYPSLTVLNIGCNLLRCEFISRMRDALITNTSLQRLGLQATELACSGVQDLADILKSNTTLERVDLRENKILIFGLRALWQMMETNKTLIQIDLSENLELPDTPHSPGLIKEIQMLCQANLRRQSASSQASAHRPVSRKISLTSQTLHQDSYPVPSRLTEPKKVTGKLRSPAPSPIPSPVSSPIPMITKSRFSVSRVSETDCQGIQPLSRFKVSAVEPPKSVTSNSGAVTIGFDCQNQDLPNIQSEQDSVVEMEVCATPSVSHFQNSGRPSENDTSVKNEYDNRTDETVNPLTMSDNLTAIERIVMQNISVPKPDEKPMTSLEKLLSLFQTPSPFFNRNYQGPSTADKKESLMKTTNQLFTQTFFPFVNSNTSKSVTTISNISDIDTQSVKENISPENSLSLFSPKAKSYEDYEEKFSSQPSALDSGVSKGKQEFVCAQLCSSFEESDSCFTGVDSTTSSISVTDSGMNDETASTYDNSRSNIEVNADSQKSRSSESDLTNNNSWKPPNTNSDPMETSVVIPQDEITDWQSDND